MPLRLDQVNFGLKSSFNCNAAAVADRSANVILGMPVRSAMFADRSQLLPRNCHFVKSGRCRFAEGGGHSDVVSRIFGCDSDLRFFNLDREDPVWRVSQDANRRSSDPV